MHHVPEKLLFGFASLTSTALCSIGAIMTAGEQRWIYVTLAIGIMCSAFLALMFRKENESIRITVGRCGLSVMGSMFGSPLVVHFYKISDAENNILHLAGIAMLVCIGSFFIGYAFLKSLDRNSGTIGGSVTQFLIAVVKTFITKKP